MVCLEVRGAFDRPAHRAIEGLTLDRFRVRERRFPQLVPEDVAQASVLADDLRTRPDQAMDRDEDSVCLLAQEVARQEAMGGGPGSERIARREPALCDDREGVLEAVGEAFPLCRETVVTEAFEEVPVVELDGGLRTTGVVVQASLESPDIEIDPGIDPDPDRVAVDIDQLLRLDPGLGEALSYKPEGLAK